jgi:hypothetical protein
MAPQVDAQALVALEPHGWQLSVQYRPAREDIHSLSPSSPSAPIHCTASTDSGMTDSSFAARHAVASSALMLTVDAGIRQEFNTGASVHSIQWYEGKKVKKKGKTKNRDRGGEGRRGRGEGM